MIGKAFMGLTGPVLRVPLPPPIQVGPARTGTVPGSIAGGHQRSKSWIYRYTRAGRAREMGLGSLHGTSLAQARDLAERCRQQVRDGLDPIDVRKEDRAAARLVEARSMTFGTCARAFVEAHRAEWRNAKHRDQWRSTLETYAFPVFGQLPIGEIDTTLIMRVVEPIWQGKTETASRVRGRIEAILDWATVRGFRRGDNPARWRGHLDHLLPDRPRCNG